MRKIRTRLVNFRVTDEEFEQLKTASDRLGARCLSDFARSVMLGQADPHPVSSDDRLLSFDRRLTALERSMSRLVAALAGAQLQTAGSDN